MAKRKRQSDDDIDVLVEEKHEEVIEYGGYDEEWIKIKMDGVYFETKRDTLLLADPGSQLQSIASGRWEARSNDGAFQFDRDPRLFRYILDYLRNNRRRTLKAPEHEEESVIEEFVYFGLVDYIYQEGQRWLHGLEHSNIDGKKADEFFIKASKMGHQCAYGLCLYKGIGYEEDKARGVELLQCASDAGDAFATYRLGVYYEGGKDVDYARVLELYRKSADAGSVIALRALGFIYLYGRGMESENEEEAFRLFNEALEKGCSAALDDVGGCYNKGWGVDRDIPKALEMFERGKALGCPDAMHALGFLYMTGLGVTENYYTAYRLYKKSVELGCEIALISLASCYTNGYGVPKNACIAFSLYRRYAELEPKEGLFWFARCYETGAGVIVDKGRALELYLQAVDAGDGKLSKGAVERLTNELATDST